MLEVNPILADHKDVIHDVAFDFYGRRMVTCSSDQMLKIWDEDNNGQWQVSSSWKAHSGAIWRTTWAHPEYGQVIATCSFDRTAAIWEEVIIDKTATESATMRRWVRRSTLLDARTSLTDVKFAPKYLGLLLATTSADGIIRIYVASNITNLNHWVIQHEFNNKLPLSCLSWNTSKYRLPAQLLAAGSDETATSTGKLFIFSYIEEPRKFQKIETVNEVVDPVTDLAFAPNTGRSFHLLAIASKDLYIIIIRGPNENVTSNGSNFKLEFEVLKFNEHNCPVGRVCWNMLATMLISTGDDACVRIWRMNNATQWKCAALLRADLNNPTDDSQLRGTLQANAVTTAQYYKRGTISNPNQVPWH